MHTKIARANIGTSFQEWMYNEEQQMNAYFKGEFVGGRVSRENFPPCTTALLRSTGTTLGASLRGMV